MRYGGSWLLNDLLHERMSASKVSKFNDPFEANVKSIGSFSNAAKNRVSKKMEAELMRFYMSKKPHLKPKDAKKKARKQLQRKSHTFNYCNKGTEKIFNKEDSHKIIEKTSRIICFVDPNVTPIDDTRMWGYYSDNHTGSRVHLHTHFFKCAGLNIKKVDYLNSPPEVNFTLQYEPKYIDEYEKSLSKIIFTKSLAWQHENEIRVFCLLQLISIQKGEDGEDRDFIHLSPFAISRIDIGIKAGGDLEKAKQLQKINPTILIYRTVMPSGEYYPCYELVT